MYRWWRLPIQDAALIPATPLKHQIVHQHELLLSLQTLQYLVFAEQICNCVLKLCFHALQGGLESIGVLYSAV